MKGYGHIAGEGCVVPADDVLVEVDFVALPFSVQRRALCMLFVSVGGYRRMHERAVAERDALLARKGAS